MACWPTFRLESERTCLFLTNSDHNGWTALHHASLGGYTQTMKVILDTNLKSTTDQRDEEGVRTVFLVPTQNLGGEETSKLAGSRLLSHAPRLLALPVAS